MTLSTGTVWARLLLCTLAALLAPSRAVAACTANVQFVDNGHWYQRCDETTSWLDAAESCEALGGYLATITSAAEDSFVYSNFGASATGITGLWIGASDVAQEGSFSWITGESFSYHNFVSPEPNNCSGIEHYAAYFVPPDSRAGTWNDFGDSSSPPGACGCGGCGAGVFATAYVCESGCGNGLVESGEDCDDGARVGGDGCSSRCQDERCHGVTSGIASWWPLDGTLDDVVSSRSLSLGATPDQPEFADGIVREGLDLDSDFDLAFASHDAAFDVNAPGFTADFWMAGSKAAQPASIFNVLEKSHGLVDSTGWAFQGNSATGSIYFQIGGGGGGAGDFYGAGSIDVLDGNPHHVAGVWDGTDVILYVDGVLQGSQPLASPANNTRDLRVGSWWGGGRNFRGIVDEITIWSRALGASEIAALAGAGSGGRCKDCAATGISSGALCGDGLYCAGTFACDDAECVLQAPRDCDDGNVCTVDSCDEGGQVCDHGETLTCDDGSACTADSCDPEAGCQAVEQILPDCRDALASKLLYKGSSLVGKDKLKWIWKLGAATTQQELSDPTETAGYELCLFGETSADELLLGATQLPPSSTLWRPIGDKGYKYIDPATANDGIKKVIAKGGIEGKALIKLIGKGEGLADPPLPLDPSITGLRVQLVNDETGICWESVEPLDSIKGE